MNENEQTNTQLIITGGPMGSKIIVEKLQLNKIKLGKNSRKEIRDAELEGLMQSIKETGLLQPIGVTKNGTGYEILYGNRRFLACSKLGFKHIPVIVHENQKESDIDIKNLTENIQRRNIGLAEAGRYIELLEKQNLTLGEIAVRLGVPKGYVEQCRRAFQEVPKEFRNDLEVKVVRHGKTRTAPGKIALATATAIGTARRRFALTREETKQLFAAAKKDEFNHRHIGEYVGAMRSGEKDFLAAAPETKAMNVTFEIHQREYDSIYTKYVDKGPFRSVSAVMVAALKGEVALQLKTVNHR